MCQIFNRFKKNKNKKASDIIAYKSHDVEFQIKSRRRGLNRQSMTTHQIRPIRRRDPTESFYAGYKTHTCAFHFTMAAVQGGLVESVDKKESTVEPSEESAANNSNNASDGRLLSPPPGSGAPAGGNNSAGAGNPTDQQTLLAVLQFLKKNNLAESVEILRREAGLPEDSADAKAGDSSAAGAAANSSDQDGGDASALLSRVTVSAAAVAPVPSKGSLVALLLLRSAPRVNCCSSSGVSQCE